MSVLFGIALSIADAPVCICVCLRLCFPDVHQIIALASPSYYAMALAATYELYKEQKTSESN